MPPVAPCGPLWRCLAVWQGDGCGTCVAPVSALLSGCAGLRRSAHGFCLCCCHVSPQGVCGMVTGFGLRSWRSVCLSVIVRVPCCEGREGISTCPSSHLRGAGTLIRSGGRCRSIASRALREATRRQYKKAQRCRLARSRCRPLPPSQSVLPVLLCVSLCGPPKRNTRSVPLGLAMFHKPLIL